jgi:hypothetical protein
MQLGGDASSPEAAIRPGSSCNTKSSQLFSSPPQLGPLSRSLRRHQLSEIWPVRTRDCFVLPVGG